jgi:AcrR family transcriptional regulator
VSDVYGINITQMVTVSTSQKPAYHHGDLRAALVEAGLTLIAMRTADDLSLREVARHVGVSATAVYRHFPDKASLMGALAGAGLAMLGEAQHAAFDAAGGGAAGFNATGSAYVRFALRHTALFRLIFANPMKEELLELTDAPADAMRFLMANAAALAPADMEPRIYALQSWSIAHGLAMLLIDGQLRIDDGTIDQVIDAHAALAG